MALELSIQSGGPEVVGEIVLIPVDQIDASNRLRPVDPVWAAALGGAMAAEGQRTPIEVCRLPGQTRYTLVCGGHRHAGAEIAFITHLRAEIVSSDAAERKLREVSENLLRRDLSPLDRAAAIAQLVALYKVRNGVDPNKDGRAASANARWQKQLDSEAEDAKVTMTFAYGWNDALAEELGFSAETIKRDLYLARRLAPSVIEELREADHDILNNAAQLRALAKLEPTEQAIVAKKLASGAKSVSDARGTGNGPKAADDKNLSAFLGAFGRMSVTEKKGALALLAKQLPAGWSLTGPEGGAA